MAVKTKGGSAETAGRLVPGTREEHARGEPQETTTTIPSPAHLPPPPSLSRRSRNAMKSLDGKGHTKVKNPSQSRVLRLNNKRLPQPTKAPRPKAQEAATAAVARKVTRKEQVRSELSLPPPKRRRNNHGAVVPTKKVQKEERSRKLPTGRVNLTPTCDDLEGHHIIVPGAVLQTETSKYEMQVLLGEGSYGRVAECTALTSSQPERLVAIKICRAKPHYQLASKKEYNLLRRLMEADPENVHRCIRTEDFFGFRSYFCIVFPLLGVSLATFLEENEFRPFPRDHVRDLAFQLLDSVRFLHELGIIHTDLKPANILLVSDESRMFSRRTKQRTHYQKVLNSTEVRLIDFGCAVSQEESRSHVVTTLAYRAPEIILDMGWSFRCDLFSLGCIFVELYTGRKLFPSADPFEHLALIQAVMGTMPASFESLARKNKPLFFKANNELEAPTVDIPKDAKDKVAVKVEEMKSLTGLISQKDNSGKNFVQLVQQMLAYDPEVRIKVQQAIESPYILSEAFEDTAWYTAYWRVVS